MLVRFALALVLLASAASAQGAGNPGGDTGGANLGGMAGGSNDGGTSGGSNAGNEAAFEAGSEAFTAAYSYACYLDVRPREIEIIKQTPGGTTTYRAVWDVDDLCGAPWRQWW